MPLSLKQIAERPRQNPDWVIPGLLKRGNTAIIMGQPKKACKSWLILSGMWDLSEGRAMWGIDRFKPSGPLVCVYFTQEDSEDDAQDRTLAVIAGSRQPNELMWIVPKNLQIAFDTPSGRRIIEKELDEVKAKTGHIDLVAFDPMRRMHHGDENDSQTIVQMWGVLDRIHQRYGCATIISHHIRKPPSDTTGYDPSDPFTGRGSGDIYGGGDAFIMSVPGQGCAEFRKLALYFETKRGEQPPPAIVKVVFARGEARYLGQGQAPTIEGDLT